MENIEQTTVTVAPGRTIFHGVPIAAQITRTTRTGEVEVVSPAVSHERLYGPGETLSLPADEARHLIASGAALLPGGSPTYPTAAPRLVDEIGDAA